MLKEHLFYWGVCFFFFFLVIFYFTRMNSERFDHLLSLFHNSIKRTNTRFYKVITAGACLAITLRFLVWGEAQQSLSYSFCKGKSTVCKIISEMCEDIYKALKEPYLKSPFFRRQEKNSEISRSFEISSRRQVYWEQATLNQVYQADWNLKSQL